MLTYDFLQHYWWFLVSLLAGLLVFLLFVQGANTLMFTLGRNENERRLVVNATGRKWEFTFTTLVTFGGAFFASFPLFYSVSFGGAYWVWMLILLTFVLQAVSYEFQSRSGNVLGRNVYRDFLVLNGLLAPLLIGTAVGTFFNGAAFEVDTAGMASGLQPSVSRWVGACHGLEAVTNGWNLVLGVAVLFLARVLGSLYLINSVEDEALVTRARRQVLIDGVPFVLTFVAFVIHVLVKDGVATTSAGVLALEPYSYARSLAQSPWMAVAGIVGVLLVLWGMASTLVCRTSRRGIWWSGVGTVVTVLVLFLLAAYNGRAYYPSSADVASSLTLANSASSPYTLRVMSYVSVLIPFVLAYIWYAWRAINRRRLTTDELQDGEHHY